MEKKKVLIGMSGGVDSSVSALLLKEQGYDVYGVTLKLWEGGGGNCCSLESTDDARRVASQIGIPYYVWNFTEDFRKYVVDNFVDEYFCARTPNPCVMCNRYIKFSILLHRADALGIDYIATGHYAKKEFDAALGRYLLKKSKDARKDQTYFLYPITQNQLKRTLFPLADYTKSETRKIAKEYSLAVAEKRESQEICFVENGDYRSFLEKYSGKAAKEGNFVLTSGEVIGKHKGLIYYTVGQRRGLGIAWKHPLYVVRLDAEKNEVVLGEEKEIFSRELIVGNINMISVPKLEREMVVSAKIRYGSREAEARLIPQDECKAKLVFKTPQRAVTPGQSAVFYDGDTVVGGGIIETKC